MTQVNARARPVDPGITSIGGGRYRDTWRAPAIMAPQAEMFRAHRFVAQCRVKSVFLRIRIEANEQSSVTTVTAEYFATRLLQQVALLCRNVEQSAAPMVQLEAEVF